MKKHRRPKKLTRDLKLAVAAYGLYLEQWLLCEEGDSYVRVVNRISGTKMLIDRYARK